ncbi:MAG: hypothetical protein J6Q41_07020 [Firmicutes bacterium]|nr:hypothetical protein [Bacillota bacterium]
MIAEKTKSLENNAAEGRIRACGGHNRNQFYLVTKEDKPSDHSLNPEDANNDPSENNLAPEDANNESKPKEKKRPRGKYLKDGPDNAQLIAALVQKEYDSKVIRNAESELKTLNILIRKYEKGTCENIYEGLCAAKRALVKPVTPTDEEYADQWLSEPYEPLGFAEGEPVFETDSGLRVRSKAEIMYGNKFDEMGVIYKYECPLFLKGYGTSYPDFTILNVRLRKVLYLEVLGEMDDPGYAERNIKKIQAYQRNGYHLGKQLLLGFDLPKCPTSLKDIEEMAKIFFQ